MLDYILGKPVAEGEKRRVRCVISAGKEDTTHPRQVVVNALIRRGCEPKATRDFNVIRFPGGDVPKRKDWVPLQPLPFKQIVEEYD